MMELTIILIFDSWRCHHLIENPMSLSGKKYLVTGASSGIGQATAIMISKLGGRVILNGRNEKRLKETVSQMEGEGHYVMPYDLSNPEGVKEYVRRCVAVDNTKLDGMVHSAGIGRDVPIRVEKREGIEQMMRIVYYSYVELLKEGTTKRAMNDGGSIVALSSSCVSKPVKSKACYSSAKAAVEMTSKVAALEMAPRKIRVNVVRPDLTLTAMTQEIFLRLKEDIPSRFPLGYLTAEDIANTIVFLLSGVSSKITGQCVLLNAGYISESANILGLSK